VVFFIHDSSSGVPVKVPGTYIHVRMEVQSHVTEEEFIEKLPWYCEFTRKIAIPTSLDGCDIETFVDYDEAWAVMGEMSEVVLRLVHLHKGYIPALNIAQLIHYQDNMLQLDMLKYDITKRLIKSKIFRILDYIKRRLMG